MDSVRFGRALGYGVRHAARTLAEAAKAAAAPSAAPNTRPAGTPAASPGANLPTPQQAGTRPRAAVFEAGPRARTQARRAGRSVFAPLRRAGGVLWLELTGTVFALFAIFMAPGLWKLRGSFAAGANSPEAHKFYLYALIFALFTYFAVTSFLRARRRGRLP